MMPVIHLKFYEKSSVVTSAYIISPINPAKITPDSIVVNIITSPQ